MTYERCAFLCNNMVIEKVLGHYARVYKCTNPKCAWDVCFPSHPSYPGYPSYICPFFRIKSVMNSFGTGKEDGDG